MKYLRLIGYVLYVLLAVEAGLQGFYYATSGSWLFKRNPNALPIFQTNGQFGHALKPNLAYRHATNEFDVQLYTNSQGFRTSAARAQYRPVKDESTYRILLLGPSFAFGWGVNYEETFGSRLEGYLKEAKFANGRRIELINAGVPALGLANQLRWFDADAKNLTPDLVVQFVYASLVLPSDEAGSAYAYDVTPEGYLKKRFPEPGERIRNFLKQFATVHYSWIIYTLIASRIDGTAAEGKIIGAGRELTQQSNFEPSSPEWTRSMAIYEHLNESVRAAQGRLLIVYFPLSYAVHPQDKARWKHLGVTDVEGMKTFNEKACSYLNTRGIACLNIEHDLTEEVQRSAERLYYWLDVHWTPTGNRIAAEAVARHLVRGEHRPQARGGE
ncbi:MAG TPA: hypothetical protein VED01_25325 [Burkholderiales bacterium]|nr:hypothetical protein [Burkholderiales bacterium]